MPEGDVKFQADIHTYENSTNAHRKGMFTFLFYASLKQAVFVKLLESYEHAEPKTLIEVVKRLFV